MPSERSYQRLARIAKPLEPHTAPYFVNSYRRGHPANGWYWTPKGTQHPQFLGRNHIEAEIFILTRLEELEPAHAA